jgi:hypothetical protein
VWADKRIYCIQRMNLKGKVIRMASITQIGEMHSSFKRQLENIAFDELN